MQIVIGLTVALAVSLLVAFLLVRADPQGQAEELMRRAMLLAAQGDMAGAEEATRQAIALDGGLAKAHRLAAECAMARRDFEQALDDLSRIPNTESTDWIAARQIAADILHNHVYRFREAERAYLDVLSVTPEDVFANNGYTRLLGLCGRRQEAIPHVLRLIRAGEETDLLVMLSRESGAINDPDMLAAGRAADPADPNPLLGQAAAAASAQKPEIALEKLQLAAELEGLPNDFHGRIGRQLLDNQRFSELGNWSRELTTDSMCFESWLVLAQLAERSKDDRGAARCYWEAVKLRPESLNATNQLARRLTLDGQAELAAPIARRVELLNKFRDLQRVVIMSDEQPSEVEIAQMVDAYRSVGRLWEALAWGKLTLRNQPQNEALRQVMRLLPDSILTLPLELTVRDANLAFQIDLSHYPIPSFYDHSSRPGVASSSKDIFFSQSRTEIGLDFQYFDGSEGTTRRMFEFGGCGIAVVDIDNDEVPDIYCVQGKSLEPSGIESDGRSDRLFRNLDGQRFVDVSRVSNVIPESYFGQGVSAGDINNDGFADIYVANIGPNRILLNNGDGTFSEGASLWTASEELASTLKDQGEQWTTSCLVADLNGDSIPDLYDVNYLSGDDLFERVCANEDGNSIQCSPYEFEPALDQLWLGDGSGGFIADTEFLSPPPLGKGLGIVAMDVGNGRLSFFVSNDTTANFFYTALSNDASTLTESAMTAGLAFNGEGKAEACMGIAVGDCTHDGRLDLLVTNFLYESNTLYSPLDAFSFEDKTRDVGLHGPTLPVLGWGTQFLDANLDGRLEAFVVNGYPQDLSKYGTPYEMRPQIFEWVNPGFQELPAGQAGEWSSSKAVGRTVARMDWNLDGKADLAVGLMDAPHYILTNTSRTDGRKHFTLELIATKSARDAIGTTVTATIDGSLFTHQLTAGDGYASSNERRLFIGCGGADEITRLSIAWPSGMTQEFNEVSTSQSVVAVEGRKELLVSPLLIH